MTIKYLSDLMNYFGILGRKRFLNCSAFWTCSGFVWLEGDLPTFVVKCELRVLGWTEEIERNSFLRKLNLCLVIPIGIHFRIFLLGVRRPCAIEFGRNVWRPIFTCFFSHPLFFHMLPDISTSSQSSRLMVP